RRGCRRKLRAGNARSCSGERTKAAAGSMLRSHSRTNVTATIAGGRGGAVHFAKRDVKAGLCFSFLSSRLPRQSLGWSVNCIFKRQSTAQTADLDVPYVTKLAPFNLTGAETQRFQKQLGDVLKYAEKLREV